MPPVLLAVAGAVVSGVVSGAAISSIAVSAVLSGLAAAAKMALGGKPKAPDFTPFVAAVRDRTQIVRIATEPHKIVYGDAKISGQLSGAFSTDSNDKLHLVVACVGHKVARFQETYFNDTVTTEARFDGKYRLNTALGTCFQAADSALVSEVTDWTAAHRLRGLAYLYPRETWDRDTWPTGIPNIASVVSGREVYDPRVSGVDVTGSTAADPAVFTTDSAHGFSVGDRVFLRDHAGAAMKMPADFTGVRPAVAKEFEVASVPTAATLTLCDPYRRSDAFDNDNSLALATGGTGGTLTRMAWTNNWALCVADYHWAPFGGNCDVDEVDQTSLIAAANVSDEYVTVTDNAQECTADAAPDSLALAAGDWETGDRVQVSTDGTLPGGLSAATNYYWIRAGKGLGQLATTLANARAFSAIDLTDAGSGSHTVTKNAQLRYTCNGAFKLDELPPSVVEDMLTAGMGARPYNQGTYKIIAGAYATPSGGTIDEDSLAGEISIDPFPKRQELYNAVRGTFVDPSQLWVATDFPLLTNALYEGQDGGERIYRDIELRFTTDATRAQRLAMIALKKSRDGETAVLPCNWSVLEHGIWDTISVSIAALGWASKTVRITDIDYPDGGGVTLTVQAEDSSSWSWSAGDATVLEPPPNTSLPDAFTVAPPGPPAITETLYDTRDGGGVKVRADMVWAASDDAFVTRYEPEYKPSADSAWIALAATREVTASAFDLAPRLYDFRVTAVNSIGVRSNPADATVSGFEIRGLLDPPSAPTGMTIAAAGGQALIRFDRAADLDVRQGGHGEMRHSPAVSGALWAESASIGEKIDGDATVAPPLALKAGSYLLKWVDASDIKSTDFAVVTTKQATALAYSDLSTLEESTAFSGGKSGVSVDGGKLKLAGASNIDDWGAVDDIADWDTEGGIASSGTYDFATNYDHGSVAPLRITANLAVQIYNALDQIDSRSGNIDDWDDFDGTGDAAPADAQIWMRQTDDDPSVSPTWTDWQRLDSAEVVARAAQFQGRLSSADPSYNIRVETCGAVIAEVA